MRRILMTFGVMAVLIVVVSGFLGLGLGASYLIAILFNIDIKIVLLVMMASILWGGFFKAVYDDLGE